MAQGMKTGGRQQGTPNKATVERRLRAAHGMRTALDDGLLPLDVILTRMRDELLPSGQRVTDEQFQAAVAAAPYMHQKLAATTLKGDPTAPLLPPSDTRPPIASLIQAYMPRAPEVPTPE
jgi:hypothetical protein